MSDQDDDVETLETPSVGLPSKQDMATENMQQAFHRLELEVVNTRNTLGAKVDAALVNLSKMNTAALDTKIESLEQLITGNLEKTKELSEALTNLSSNMRDNNVKIDASQIEKLANSVSNHPSLTQLATTLSTLRKEVAQSATLEVVQTGVQGLSDSLNTLESQVKNISQKITKTNDASNRDMAL